MNGAPLDIFLSANQDFPKKLENTAKGVKGTRFTYAIGKLLLFSTNKDLFNFTFPNIILSQKIKYIGIGEGIDDMKIFDSKNFINSFFN